ncbi:MAG: hypothetical protein AAGF23_12675 [Acidobacteriota bacterium]
MRHRHFLSLAEPAGLRLFLGATLLGLALAGTASADPYLSHLEVDTPETAVLVRMDLETRAREVVGDTRENLLELQFDARGRLWAASADALFRVDPATAQATRIGDFGDVAPNPSPDLAISAEGELWMKSSSFDETELYTVSLSTGAATLRDRIPVSASGIAFAGDKLFVLSRSDLMEFDPATGELTTLAPAFPGAGGFFGVMDSFDRTLYYQWINLVSVLPVSLIAYDLETGETTNVASSYAFARDIRAAAICGTADRCRDQVTNVPAADALGLGVLAALLALAGVTLQRRATS